MFTYRKIAYGVAALTLGAITAGPVAAATTVGSGAYGVYVNLTVANVLVGTVTTGSIADNTGGASYAESNPLISASNYTSVLAQSGSGLNLTKLNLGLSTGVIDNDISGGPLPGTQVANASSVVNNLNLSLATQLLNLTPISFSDCRQLP